MYRSSTLTITLIALALASLLAGCGKQQEPRFLLVGCDNSQSVGTKGIENYTGSILEPILEDESDSGIKVSTFTHEPATIYESERVGEIENLYGTIDGYIKGHLTKEEGTYYTPTFRLWIKEAKLRPQAQIVGILLTDGDCNDPKETKKIAEELARVNNFAVLYVGPVTDGETRSRLERILEPLLVSGKLVVSGDNDIASAIDTFQKKERNR